MVSYPNGPGSPSRKHLGGRRVSMPIVCSPAPGRLYIGIEGPEHAGVEDRVLG